MKKIIVVKNKAKLRSWAMIKNINQHYSYCFWSVYIITAKTNTYIY